MNYDEKDFEIHLIDLFKKEEYIYLNSSESNKKRNFVLNECIFFNELFKSIEKINNVFLDDKTKLMIQNKLNDLKEHRSLFVRNKNAFNYLKNGITIEKTKNEFQTYKLVDFDNINNNIFQVTNQLKFKNLNIYKIPDIVIYLNGLPIIIWELKTPKKELKILDDDKNLLKQAHNQIENYKNHISELFTFNFFNVISNLTITKYGATFSELDRFFYWFNPEEQKHKNSKDISEFIKNLFNKKIILELMEKFTIFQNEKQIKIIPMYHQYYAVKSSIKNISSAINDKFYKAGLIFHATGTGKSNTMIFLSKNFNDIFPKSTILVISDRIDLDDQIYNNFLESSNFLMQEPEKIISINDLVEKLKNHNQDGIFFSTVQKFQEQSVPLLSNRSNILVIVDEAHRSHNNLEFGNAKTLRNSFPNATFIGFTGTPRDDNDASTIEIFGDIISSYTMHQAEKDGFVVPLVYERRHKKLKLTNESATIFKEKYDIFFDDIDETKYNKEMIKKEFNKELKNLINIYSNPKRLEEIAEDFINIYNKRKNQVKGKALFLSYNRKTGFDFYKILIKKDSSFKEITKLIATPNSSDDPEMLNLIGTKSDKEKWAREFKNENSNFKIAIVIDMWLTGFDNPCLDMLFIDKPIKKHNLIQAISRVNRVYTQKKEADKDQITKINGVLIDYFGISDNLIDAMKKYYNEFNSNNSVSKNNEENFSDLDEIKEKLLNLKKEIFSKFLNNIEINYSENTDLLTINQILESMFYINDINAQNEFISKSYKLEKLFKSVTHLLNETEKKEIDLFLRAFKNFNTIKLNDFNEENVVEIKKLKEDLINSLIELSGSDVIKNFKNGREIKLKDLLMYNSLKKESKIQTALNISESIIKLECKFLSEIKPLKADEILKKAALKIEEYNNSFISFQELINLLSEYRDSINIELSKIKNLDDNEFQILKILYNNKNLDDKNQKWLLDQIKIITKNISEQIEVLKLENNKLWLENKSIHSNIRVIIKDELYKYHIYEDNDINKIAYEILESLN